MAPDDSTFSKFAKSRFPNSQIQTVTDLKLLVFPQSSTAAKSIYGVNLLADDEITMFVLSYFLHLQDFRVTKSLKMFNKTLQWRNDNNIDGLILEDLPKESEGLEGAFTIQGEDEEGNIVCYNRFSGYEIDGNKFRRRKYGYEVRKNTFFRWKIKRVENIIREILATNPEDRGSMTCTLVNDMTGTAHWDADNRREAWRFINCIEEHYPFVFKQIFINAPRWVVMWSLFQRLRIKSTFEYVGASTNILFEHISPDQIPISYGGLGEFHPKFIMKTECVKPKTQMLLQIHLAQTISRQVL